VKKLYFKLQNLIIVYNLLLHSVEEVNYKIQTIKTMFVF